VRANLEQQHFQPVVASTLREVPEMVEMEEPAAVVLDVGADESALVDAMRRVGELSAAPVLLLAHRHDPDQCARLLDAGAADYIAKPFSIDELLARLRVATRTRSADELDEGDRVVATGDLTIDLGRRVVSVAGADVRLSKTEFKLLKALAQHAGAVLSHDELLARVWGAGYRQETDFVWVYMRRLRRKIEPDPAHPRYLLTTPGVGYRLAKLPAPLPA
jgi:two-component system KDP operon response regulator KdpE